MNYHNGKILIVGDPHFGIRSNSEKYLQCFYNFFTIFLKKIIEENNIYDVRIMGDFFNDRNTVNVQTLNVGLDVMNFYYKTNKNVLFTLIIGNHDTYFNHTIQINSLRIFEHHPNVRIIDDVLIEQIHNKSIVSVPWIVKNTTIYDKFMKIINDNKTYDYLLGHLEIDEFIYNDETSKKKEFTIDMFKNFNKVLSGHIHKQIIENNIIYVGTPYEVYWSDYECKKGVYILNLNNDSLQFIENTYSPKHIILKLSKIKNCINEQKNIVHNNIIKLVIDENEEERKIIEIISQLEKFEPFKLDIENITIHQDTIKETTDININEDIKHINKDPLNFLVDYIQNTEFTFEKTNKQFILELIKNEYMHKVRSGG